MSNPTTPKYDVFLSFRGEDTRDSIVSHLYAELCSKKIEPFIDDRLGRGEEISPALYRAIEGSKIYVIILSEHYASSTWCLDELTEILKCKERYGREVIPVFYKVDPSNVRHQRHSYADNLVKHHQRFGAKVDAWKAALTQVAGLSGWDSQVTRPESTLVAEIVKDILKKLNHCFGSGNYEGMTGIDKHIERIQSLLLLQSPTVRIIGIWGMGGIGKTTIASAIFEKLATQFSSRSIVLNVQQEIKRGGLDHVKSKYLSQLLEEDCTSSEYNKFSFGPRLKRTKVLLVFDDVKDSDQLKYLIGKHSNFGQGSRIIVTSRDKQVLENASADEIYQVREFDYQDSLQIFCLFAFKENHPIEPYVSLSEKILDYAKGLPLALKVLGSLLYGKTKEVWESQLQKLKKLPDLKIFRLLKLSYDGLDEEQRDIFLDIACFYRGELEKVVAQTLDCCGFSARIGMDVLEDRCLIYISEGRVWMHDLIQEMGHEVVWLQCVDGPAKRSRLWKPNDIYDVLSKNKGKGTDAIQYMLLDISKIKKVQLHAKTFKKMHNLRMIKFYNGGDSNVTFQTFLKSLPDHLRFLCWDEFPQRSLPQKFCPENLVILELPYSNLEQLWEEDQALPNMKRLDLSNSMILKRLPDLSLSPNIEEVLLSGCFSLIHVYSSSFLDNLNWLCLDGCTKLERLNIHSNILSRSSGLVALHGCCNLEILLISSRTDVVQSDNCPPFNQNYINVSVRVFNDEMEIQCDGEGGYEIENTSINEFCWLDVSNCISLTCLPTELLNLKFLRRLCLSGCLKLEVLPEIEETVENLKVLTLDETAIKELPTSLHRLVGLEELSLKSCTKLKIIPSSIGNLSKLLKLDLTDCGSLETSPSSIFKLKLTELDFQGCSMLRTFPEILEPAESFTHINLAKSAIQELPSSLHLLVGLEELSLKSCTKLKTIPSSIGNLSKLVKLNLADCVSLETFPSSIFKLKLTKLDFQGCSMLWNIPEIPNDIGQLSSLTELSLQKSGIVNLPESIVLLSSLTSLNLSDCKWLECIPNLPRRLNKLLAFDCPSIKRVVLNSMLKLMSDSEGGTFRFCLTNSQKLDVYSWSNIGVEAWIRIIGDAYKSVFFHFPGSAVPCWFPCHCHGNSVSMNTYDPYWWGENSLVGFAVCVVLGHEGMGDTRTRKTELRSTIRFESNGQTHFLPNGYGHFFTCKDEKRSFVHDHTFIWTYKLDLESIGNRLFHAHNFTVEFQVTEFLSLSSHLIPITTSFLEWMANVRPNEGMADRQSIFKVKECGVCPLFTKDNDDNSIEELHGRKAAQ